MSEKYKFDDPAGMYFVTLAIVGWIDLFTRWELKHVILDSLRHCQKEKGLVIHAWCLMPSHLHMINSSDNQSLGSILRDFKRHTNKELIESINHIDESRREWILGMFSEVAEGLNRIRKFKVWQDGNHPEMLITPKFTMQKLDYLHNNPVAAEIVDEPEDYLYSSARDYYTKKKGYLDVVLIE